MEATSPSTSHSLLRHVQRGDAQAWQRFATLYVPVVYQWTRRAGLQSSDALDVVQNVFISVIRALPAFRQEEAGGGLRAWLRTITRNAVIDWHRAQGRQPPPLADDHPQWDNLLADSSATDASLPLDERTLLVLQAAEILQAQVEPTTWDMFWQLTVEGLSVDQIAATRGVSPWAIYKAKARVLARIRELVGDFEG